MPKTKSKYSAARRGEMMKGFVNNLDLIQPAAVFDIQLKGIVYQ